MAKLTASIERIANGYIVTEQRHDREKPEKRYYESLEQYMMATLVDDAREQDKYFREHDADGTVLELTYTLGEPEEVPV